MPKPNYKKAAKELMKILDEVEESKDEEGKAAKRKGQIVDVTEESLGTVYQFTDLDLTVYKNSPDKNDTDEKTKQQKELKMASPKDKKLPSGKTLRQVQANLDRKFKGKDLSKNSSKDFPSMTLEEQRREGLSTEPIVVISFGRRKKKGK